MREGAARRARGLFVRYPLGGYAWQALHFLAGFHALGCDVFFYADTAYYADAYVPGADSMQTMDYDYGVRAAGTFFGAHGFGDAWGFWDAGADRWHGAGAGRTRAALADADLFVNLAGVNRVPVAHRPRAVAAYADLDPAYTQLRLAEGDAALADMVGDHDVHFTLEENIGTDASRIPTGALRWRPIRQAIVADLWEPAPIDATAAFATIAADHPRHCRAARAVEYFSPERVLGPLVDLLR